MVAGETKNGVKRTGFCVLLNVRMRRKSLHGYTFWNRLGIYLLIVITGFSVNMDKLLKIEFGKM